MTSLGCKVDESISHGNEPYVFKIQGRLFHLAGSLLPQEGESPVYAQLYIYDPAEALDRHLQHEANRGLNRQVMAEVQDMLYRLHLVSGLGRGRVRILSPDPIPVHNPYPSHSGRVFEPGEPGEGSGDGLN